MYVVGLLAERGARALRAARSMSPVEIFGIAELLGEDLRLRALAAAPGGPKRIESSRRSSARCTTRGSTRGPVRPS